MLTYRAIWIWDMWHVINKCAEKINKKYPEIRTVINEQAKFWAVRNFFLFFLKDILIDELKLQNSLTKVALEQAWHSVHGRMDDIGKRNLYPSLKTVK
jgi:hypothetical protein